MVHLHSLLGSMMVLLSLPASADLFTVITFGGAVKDAQQTAFFEPFEKAGNDKVVHGSYTGDLQKLNDMIAMGDVSWDVVEVEAPELARGCADELFEKLEPGLAGPASDFVPGAIQPCGVGIFVRSMVLAYDQAKLKNAPNGWRDFWDTAKIGGKRGMRWGAEYNLEFALMADGVAPQEVYDVLETQAGVERAFRKLGELKSSITWWKSGAEPVRDLQDGSVIMTVAYNGRIAAAQAENQTFNLVWTGGIYEFDYWAIPKGSWNGKVGREFIAFASQPAQQKHFAENIAYSPTNNRAVAMLDPARAKQLPTAPQNIENAIPINVAFWAKHGEVLEKRFEAWVK